MDSRRLKRILELKRRIEQAKKGDLAAAREELDQAQLSLLSAQAEQRARVAALAEEAELSVNELLDRARFVVAATQQVSTANAQVAERHRELGTREEAVVLATREVRTFELLNDRDREQQRTRAKSAEQRAADEVAGSRRSKV